MGTRKLRSLPAPLEKVRRRFEHWRGTHRARVRIPQPLWESAVRMAGTYGLNRTARTLRLDYYVLKRRVQQAGGTCAALREEGGATFVELTPSPFANACECTLDWEQAGGARMRLQLKSATLPDLAALSRSFWDRQP